MTRRTLAALSCTLAFHAAIAVAAAAAADRFAYVANALDGTVSVIDTKTTATLAIIAVGEDPEAMQVTPDGRWVWVLGLGDGSVSIVDTLSRSVAARLELGARSRPLGVAFAPDGELAYIVLDTTSELIVVDTARALAGEADAVTARIPVERSVHGVAVSPDGLRVYVSASDLFSRGRLVEIDRASEEIAASIPVAEQPMGIGFDLAGDRAYVAGAGHISVVDLEHRQTVDDIVFGIVGGTVQNNQAIAVAADGTVYVTNWARSAVAVIADGSGEVDDSVSVPSPGGIALSGRGSRAYVTQRDSRQLNVIDTARREVVSTVAVGANPIAVVLVDNGATTSDGGCAVPSAASGSQGAGLVAALALAGIAARRRVPRRR